MILLLKRLMNHKKLMQIDLCTFQMRCLLDQLNWENLLRKSRREIKPLSNLKIFITNTSIVKLIHLREQKVDRKLFHGMMEMLLWDNQEQIWVRKVIKVELILWKKLNQLPVEINFWTQLIPRTSNQESIAKNPKAKNLPKTMKTLERMNTNTKFQLHATWNF